MKRIQKALLTALFTLATAGCGAPEEDEQPTPLLEEGESTGDAEQSASVNEGARLFKHETFQGNGRTCETCHTSGTGTLSPQQAQAAYIANSNGPLFNPIDSDGRLGTSYSKLLNDATVTVDITLPANVTLASDPTRRTLMLRRGIPSTIDAPSLDSVIMWDGREATLQTQARSALLGHAEVDPSWLPSEDGLNSIAQYEQTLFSSGAMKNYAKGKGPAPALPEGTTDSEKRGRMWFAETGVCGSCHGGPLLNRMTAGNPMGVPANSQFGIAFVSEFNLAGNPMLTFNVTNPDNTVTPVSSPDPGLMLVTGVPQTAGLFKMTSLRNLKNTAPYFHDSSAKTLEQVMVQYKQVLDFLGIPNTPQDIADMTAYMYLL
ncbi:cytochrome c peroxidase [Hyalangium sp.]|uniref:cytochrome c peroxidase n=1 Tax=Hyalangium sp. TaxID=2028555 RepID=UPI002D2B8B61|nr:cytochrome c peroxidase [Hyalangium sp.]HYH95204.1 cytochrome c peroxidase [Hyalangium sp.]